MKLFKRILGVSLVTVGVLAGKSALGASCNSAIGNGTEINGDCRYESCVNATDILSNGKCYCKKSNCDPSAPISLFRLRAGSNC